MPRTQVLTRSFSTLLALGALSAAGAPDVHASTMFAVETSAHGTLTYADAGATAPQVVSGNHIGILRTRYDTAGGTARRGDIAYVDFETVALQMPAYDTLYLSLVEIRSAFGSYADLYTGQADLLVGGHDDPLPPESGAPYPLANFLDDLAVFGVVVGTGVAGTHHLIDVTAAVTSQLLAYDYLRFAFHDTLDDGRMFAALGANYDFGGPDCADGVPTAAAECQYSATSRYEYPSLIAVRGSEITPFAVLPAAPILVALPPTVLLAGFGLLGLALTASRRRRTA